MTELTDRMRVCAAFILARDAAKDPWAAELVTLDAVDLLIEASNLLEVAPTSEGLGEPMEIIPADFEKGPIDITPPPRGYGDPSQTSFWVDPGGPLPGLKHSGTISPRACPQCGSRAHKKVFRVGQRMMLQCPVCATQWPFKPSGDRHG